MSLTFQNTEAPKYGTKTDIHYMLKISYVKIAEAIKDGRLAIHLIDGKIQINISEAKAVFNK
jgi:hypothetical protein